MPHFEALTDTDKGCHPLTGLQLSHTSYIYFANPLSFQVPSPRHNLQHSQAPYQGYIQACIQSTLSTAAFTEGNAGMMVKGMLSAKHSSSQCSFLALLMLML